MEDRNTVNNFLITRITMFSLLEVVKSILNYKVDE